jgi:hypothetical protein
MDKGEIERSLKAVFRILQPLPQGEFSEKLSKVSIYVDAVGRSYGSLSIAMNDLEMKKAEDPENPNNRYHEAQARMKSFQTSTKKSLSFARLNLDAALVQALEALVRRPRSAGKKDEQKKAEALKRAFDSSSEPGKAMLKHYRETSDPLDKYLVAGPWGHEYLKQRKTDLEEFDHALCEMLSCGGTPAGNMLLHYAALRRAIDELEHACMAIGPVQDRSSDCQDLDSHS